jgi:hypothetical protein
MIIACLVIGFVLVLRYLDQRNRAKDRQKLGLAVAAPADYASLRSSLTSLSERLTALENTYRELDRRLGGAS